MSQLTVQKGLAYSFLLAAASSCCKTSYQNERQLYKNLNFYACRIPPKWRYCRHRISRGSRKDKCQSSWHHLQMRSNIFTPMLSERWKTEPNPDIGAILKQIEIPTMEPKVFRAFLHVSLNYLLCNLTPYLFIPFIFVAVFIHGRG